MYCNIVRLLSVTIYSEFMAIEIEFMSTTKSCNASDSGERFLANQVSVTELFSSFQSLERSWSPDVQS